MSRYIRVRSTRPQGCHRAGMFHGVKPVVYDTNDLTPDQIRLLRAEDGRMLLVDDVDGPEAANVVPDGDKVGQVDQFTSHPEAERKAQEAEAARSVAEAERDAAIQAKADAEAARSAAANERDAAQAQLDAARAEIETLRAAVEAKAKPQPQDTRAEAILNAVRQVVASGSGLTAAGIPKVDAVEAIVGYDVTAEERDAAWQAYNEE